MNFTETKQKQNGGWHHTYWRVKGQIGHLTWLKSWDNIRFQVAEQIVGRVGRSVVYRLWKS